LVFRFGDRSGRTPPSLSPNRHIHLVAYTTNIEVGICHYLVNHRREDYF
jgi:hypothetical protein